MTYIVSDGALNSTHSPDCEWVEIDFGAFWTSKFQKWNLQRREIPM